MMDALRVLMSMDARYSERMSRIYARVYFAL